MNSANERNWLIRTTQFQILGPISKSKLLEFYNKGALGPNDEVSSGNGYWFSIRERDLVEKYLTGDMPQGYNPISESKTVLARSRSENTGTFSHGRSDHVTQVINIDDVKKALAPSSNDLAYPDMSPPSSGDLKLPTNDDLEFPDVEAIVASTNKPKESQVNTTIIRSDERIKEVVKVKANPPVESSQSASMEPAVLPKSEDLDYPDMDSLIETPVEEKKKERTSEKLLRKDATGDFTFKLDEKNLEAQTQTLYQADAEGLLDEIGFDENLNSDLEAETIEKKEVVKESKPQKEIPAPKKVDFDAPKKENIAFHERKVKGTPDKQKSNKRTQRVEANVQTRNDNYLWIILILLVLFIGFAFFYYYKEILNKPLPV